MVIQLHHVQQWKKLDLGLIINSSFSFEAHVDNINRIVSFFSSPKAKLS